jgi:hypothetical protein
MKKEFEQLLLTERQLLLAIRRALQIGDRPMAVSLAAQRYAVLKQMEELKAHHSSQMAFPPILPGSQLFASQTP